MIATVLLAVGCTSSPPGTAAPAAQPTPATVQAAPTPATVQAAPTPAATAIPTPAPTPEPETTRSIDLPPLACAAFAEGSSFVKVVPCEELHEVQNYASFEYEVDVWPGQAEFRAACIPFFEALTGTPLGESGVFDDAAGPTQTAWDGGDRVVRCVAFFERPVTGSLAQADLAAGIDGWIPWSQVTSETCVDGLDAIGLVTVQAAPCVADQAVDLHGLVDFRGGERNCDALAMAAGYTDGIVQQSAVLPSQGFLRSLCFSTRDLRSAETFGALPCGAVAQLEEALAIGSPEESDSAIAAVRVLEDASCSRLVFELGSTELPSLTIAPTNGGIRINGFNGAGDLGPRRQDYAFGSAIWVSDEGSEPYVQLAHEPAAVFFQPLVDPTRLIVDLATPGEPLDSAIGHGPIRGEVILSAPIQADQTWLDAASAQPITIQGWAPPASEALRYRIFSVDSIDLLTHESKVPFMAFDGVIPVAAAAGEWGTFEVTLPQLEPGVHAVVLGYDTVDGPGLFRGTGQLVQVRGGDQLDGFTPDRIINAVVQSWVEQG